jgi:hypothetical protein
VHIANGIARSNGIDWTCRASADALDTEHEAYSKEEILNEVEKSGRKTDFELVWLNLLFVFFQPLIVDTLLVCFPLQHLNRLDKESRLHRLSFSFLEKFFGVTLSHDEHIYEVPQGNHAYGDKSD